VVSWTTPKYRGLFSNRFADPKLFSKIKKNPSYTPHCYGVRMRLENFSWTTSDSLIYFRSSKSFLVLEMNSRIFFSTHRDISFHQWFGTGKIIFQSEKITWDHFCLTISNHNFFSFVSISRNLYGICIRFVYQKFLNFFLKRYLL